MGKWVWVLGLGMIIGTAPLYAQTNTGAASFEVRLQKEAKVFTLKEAIQVALTQNTDLLKAQNNVLKAEAQLREAKASWAPQASLASVYTGQKSGDPQQSGGNYLDSLSLRGNIDWTAFDARRTANIDIAARQLNKSRLTLTNLQRTLTLDVIEAYYDLLAAESTVKNQESALKDAQAVLNQTQLQQKNGTSTRFDTLRQQVQVANRQQELLSGQNDRDRTQLILADLLNLAQSVPVEVQETATPQPDWTQSLQATLEAAINRRPELAVLEEDLEIAQAQKKLAGADLSPTLQVGVGYGYSDVLNGLKQDELTVNASLNWVVFNGGASQAQQDQAEYDRRNSEIELRAQAQRIRTDLERAYLAKETGKAQIQSAQVALNQAQESLTLARRRQELGLSLQIEVITAERDLTQARQNLTNAVIRYNRALAELELAVGV